MDEFSSDTLDFYIKRAYNLGVRKRRFSSLIGLLNVFVSMYLFPIYFPIFFSIRNYWYSWVILFCIIIYCAVSWNLLYKIANLKRQRTVDVNRNELYFKELQSILKLDKFDSVSDGILYYRTYIKLSNTSNEVSRIDLLTKYWKLLIILYIPLAFSIFEELDLDIKIFVFLLGLLLIAFSFIAYTTSIDSLRNIFKGFKFGVKGSFIRGEVLQQLKDLEEYLVNIKSKQVKND